MEDSLLSSIVQMDLHNKVCVHVCVHACMYVYT